MAAKGTTVARAKVNLPVDIDAQLAAEAASISARLSAPSGDRIIVTQAKTFKLPDGTETDGPFDAIVVEFVAANFFYEESFERGNITPPKCFALGLDSNSLVPSDNSPDKQAESCASCWANQFGSSGKGKACQNTRLLALLPPDATIDTPVQILKVSPTAIKSFDGYVASVARAFQKPVRAVLTAIGFDPNSEYSSLRFGNPRKTDDMQLLLAMDRREEATARLLTEPDVSAARVSQPVPAKKAPAKRPAAAAKR